MTAKPYAPVRILFADDHEIFREGFNNLLFKQPDIEVLGEAENGEELLRLTDSLQPDLVLTDIKMPIMDGIAATKKISALYPQVYVIALTMSDEDDMIIDMLESGARGYLLKNAHKNEVFEAIQTVHKGDTYFCKHTSVKLMELIARSRYSPYKTIEKTAFTDRELEVIKLICDEFTNKEISDQLHLSVRTIEGYRERIQEKMKVRNGAGIAVYAIKHGLYKIPR